MYAVSTESISTPRTWAAAAARDFDRLESFHLYGPEFTSFKDGGRREDAAANAAGETLISESGSRVALYVIATDEELMIARHTLAVLSARRPIFEDKISA